MLRQISNGENWIWWLSTCMLINGIYGGFDDYLILVSWKIEWRIKIDWSYLCKSAGNLWSHHPSLGLVNLDIMVLMVALPGKWSLYEDMWRYVNLLYIYTLNCHPLLSWWKHDWSCLFPVRSLYYYLYTYIYNYIYLTIVIGVVFQLMELYTCTQPISPGHPEKRWTRWLHFFILDRLITVESPVGNGYPLVI